MNNNEFIRVVQQFLHVLHFAQCKKCSMRTAFCTMKLGLLAAGALHKSSTVKPYMHVQYLLHTTYLRKDLVRANKKAEAKNIKVIILKAKFEKIKKKEGRKICRYL